MHIDTKCISYSHSPDKQGLFLFYDWVKIQAYFNCLPKGSVYTDVPLFIVLLQTELTLQSSFNNNITGFVHFFVSRIEDFFQTFSRPLFLFSRLR